MSANICNFASGLRFRIVGPCRILLRTLGLNDKKNAIVVDVTNNHEGMTNEDATVTVLAGGIRWWGWLLGFVLLTTLLVLVTLPPFLGYGGRMVLMHTFSAICHQITERSFHIEGVSLGVCHRCYGIYVGLFFSTFLYLSARRWETRIWDHSPIVVAGSLVPMGIDWILGVVGVWENSWLSRLGTGAFFGLVAGQFIVQALATREEAKPSDLADPPPVYVLESGSDKAA